LDTREYENTGADFTSAHELNPKDAWALANRGMANAWRNDRARAEADFKAARLIDPSNPVVLRGEGLLAMNAGQFRPAADRLTESLKIDPHNAWALALRSEAYRLLGEPEKASADREAVRKLTGVTLQTH
jgi:Flp pilus assembly protein TadD